MGKINGVAHATAQGWLVRTRARGLLHYQVAGDSSLRPASEVTRVGFPPVSGAASLVRVRDNDDLVVSNEVDDAVGNTSVPLRRRRGMRWRPR